MLSVSLRLLRAEDLTEQVRELTLARVDGAPFVFQAGQWVNLHIPHEGGILRRSYSIASSPQVPERIAIAVTRVEGGPGSSFLHAMRAGDTLLADPPQGFFTRPSDLPSLFVGTGTGVTPLRSMIVNALELGHTKRMALLLGARTESTLVYKREFEALAAKHRTFSVHFCLSRANETWEGYRGYVQAHVQERVHAFKDTEPVHAYICGLRPMVEAVRDVLKTELGLPRQQIHTERYD